MSKKLTNKFTFILLCSILSFYSTSQSADNVYNFKIQNWIENIPILSSLIENKRDVVEFDSSTGKIISISFDTKNLSKKQIFSFYSDFFEKKNWQKYKTENVWETKSKRFKKKIFKIENFEDNILKIKIIIENF
jgi:hypothetical protein|tara:strand:+ start:261 stop:662 length:402 start_codon:yes stop_codon:yes gene_type:complete